MEDQKKCFEFRVKEDGPQEAQEGFVGVHIGAGQHSEVKYETRSIRKIKQ